MVIMLKAMEAIKAISAMWRAEVMFAVITQSYREADTPFDWNNLEFIWQKHPKNITNMFKNSFSVARIFYFKLTIPFNH